MDGVRQWTELPIDILSLIANRLGLIDLLSFRGTCKEFRSASSTASAEIESFKGSPWLLMPEMDNSNCVIYSNKGITYNRNIPELEGAIFLASYQGWLLLFKEGSMFFFSPFSLAKINLPKFPFKKDYDFYERAGAFSDVPTSPHCVVSIIGRRKIMVISKGQNAWTHHVVPENDHMRWFITTKTFDHRNETFYYVDESNKTFTFSVKDMRMESYPMRESLPYYDVSDPLSQILMFKMTYKDDCFGIIKNDEYVEVCGLTFHSRVPSRPLVYPNENAFLISHKQGERKAVWIQPRFFEVDPNTHW